MRRYYHTGFNVSFFHGFFRLPDEIENQKKRFIKKYTRQHYSMDYFVWPQLLRDPILLTNKIYFYEENGVCFEFFTGTEIGPMVESGRCVYVSSLFGNIDIKGGIDGNSAYELSDSQFAFDVKKIMPYAGKIKFVMQEYLDIHRSIDEYKKQMYTMQQDDDQRRNNADTTWVDNYINKR